MMTKTIVILLTIFFFITYSLPQIKKDGATEAAPPKNAKLRLLPHNFHDVFYPKSHAK